MRLGRRMRGMVVAAIAVATAAATVTAAPAVATRPLEYVALGDSFAAGPLIPPVDPNLACIRSDANYPNLAAKRLGARLNDVTCSGATTDDFAGKQHGSVPPQYDALTPSTNLVSVTIGANDVGLVPLAEDCINPLPEPVGVPCKGRWVSNGVDKMSRRIAADAPKIDRALREIHARSPHAKILVVGYGTYLEGRGCYPIAPLFRVDAIYLQDKIDEMNSLLAKESAKHHATYVDTRTPGIGHGVCQLPGTKWVEGIIPTAIAAPLHPNETGMIAFGKLVAAAARR